MFTGKFSHSIDPKNRVIVPAKYRDELGEQFIITAGLDGCLYICTMNDWNGFVDEMKKLPFTKETREFQRYFALNASECEIDKQGRIVIPSNLKELAGLKDEVIFAGAISKIEIWSPEKLEHSIPSDSIDTIAEKLATDFGLIF